MSAAGERAGGLRAVAVAACVARPWANGGGTSRDLALGAAPAAAPASSFDWRLSLADIDRDGPFSALPGVDRVFAPVEGGVTLAFDGSGARRVDDGGEPLAFDGGLAPHAWLVDGRPARALNLMCSRGRRAGAMRRVALADGAAPDADWSRDAVPGGAAVRAWFVQSGRVFADGRAHEAGTLLVADETSPAATPAPRALGPARVVEVAIGARRGAS